MHLSTVLCLCAIAAVTTAPWVNIDWWKCGLEGVMGDNSTHAVYSTYWSTRVFDGRFTACDRMLPISRCCKDHRKCYRRMGYTQQACDNMLEVCLDSDIATKHASLCRKISKAFVATVRKYGNDSYARVQRQIEFEDPLPKHVIPYPGLPWHK
ncbi:hypothetical protein PMAYCL1PPCAC_00823 [Pristionchus mayeri]|uniref:Phospholipase A2 n=1 Tax=Pristionchus mayeri TaxID=1317129 RepID=A0AAN4Z2A2_9BILA|nr:hypothetical protein PMAYCL1PPCAC_00823 [Pristionchus mayeri]